MKLLGQLLIVFIALTDACVGKRKQASSDPSQSLLAIPTLTSDYVPITVGDGISSDYDLNYSGKHKTIECFEMFLLLYIKKIKKKKRSL